MKREKGVRSRWRIRARRNAGQELRSQGRQARDLGPATEAVGADIWEADVRGICGIIDLTHIPGPQDEASTRMPEGTRSSYR